MTAKKLYLGDGVFVDHDGLYIHLTTGDGYRVTNTIVLEPEVYAALERYVARIRAERSCPNCGAAQMAGYLTCGDERCEKTAGE